MQRIFAPLFRQSLHGGGIFLLIVALSLAISATTALTFSHQQITQAIDLQASELMAADFSIESPKPLPEPVQQTLEAQPFNQSRVTVFSSMTHHAEHFVMVNVKAVDAEFPLRGTLKVEDALGKIHEISQTNTANFILQTGEVWLSPRVFDLLQVNFGDEIGLADAKLRVTGKIVHDSNQETGFSAFSPTVMIQQSDIARTNAVQVGSRIDYRVLLATDDAEQRTQIEETVKKSLAAMTPLERDQVKLRNASEGNSRLMRPIENLDTFLHLANILTILLCGLAIALTSLRFLEKNQNHIALLRCLGTSKRDLILNFILLMLCVAGVSTVLGAITGVVFGYALLELMLSLLPHLQLQFSAIGIVTGPLPIAALTSLILLMGFMLPAIWRLLETAPVQVLRPSQFVSQPYKLMAGFAIVSMLVFSYFLTKNLALAASVIGVIVIISLIMYMIVVMGLKKLKKGHSRAAAYVRHPQQMALQITALALGVSLISILTVLKTDLMQRWQQQIPEGTPNQFIYGLPPFEKDAFEADLKQLGWQGTTLYPNIRGRLLQKNAVDFSEDLVQQHNALRRELNLTQADSYPENNIVIAGQAEFSAVNQVSVEAELAERLGINIGDRLHFSIPEGDIVATVINLRTVEWESFSPNFFFIFSPNSLDAMSGSYLGSFYVPEQEQSKLLGLIQRFSNTVFIDVSQILNEVKRLVGVLAQIIQLLAWLVGGSGILVLLACINLMLDERKREIALFRSFGLSQAQLKRMLSIEMGMLGLFSGIVACLFAEGIGAVVSWKMQLPIQLHWQIWVVLPVAMTLLCALIGRYRLNYLLHLPPLETLGRGHQ